MSLVRVKNKFQITIPAEVLDKAHIKEGDFLAVEVKGESIIIKPKPAVDRKSFESAIDEGLKDYRNGRISRTFGSVKEFKAALKK